ncbi:MAG: hypothetical protein KJ017_04960 [Alphaproteobacteria bacterium]|nr:hypothetical protein [Alphaproteobacteria bacterium]
MHFRFPGARLVSFLWGFAEATFFFFVPDVWLSFLVLKRRKGIAVHIALATAGAVAGGLLMYVFGAYGFAQAQVFLDAIPAIGPGLIETVGGAMQAGPVWLSMMNGGVSGVPYKIYAVWAGHLGVPPLDFAGISAGVRALRFILVTGMVYTIGRVLRGRFSTRTLLRINGVCWAAFYVYYFYAMGF